MMAMMVNDQQIASVESAGRITLGMLAPDFEAHTTQGKVKLSDFKGKWVMLFSHPSDFTPVCTTEFIAFSKMYEEFEKRNVQLLGLSVDSLSSHIAWVRDIEEHMGVHVPFPIIADLDTKVSRLYGMIHPHISHISPIRSLFIISPDRVVKNMIFYPPGVGRNLHELLRTVDALQLVERDHVYTPANWQPGDPVLVSAPHTQQGAEDRMKEHEGLDCQEWYFCKKKI
jgi:peroxiredoxin (alkyl hydroperoxide reductase subunit C)